MRRYLRALSRGEPSSLLGDRRVAMAAGAAGSPQSNVDTGWMAGE